MDLKATIQHLAASGMEQWVRTRKHLHMHPELSFQEHNTAAFVAKELLAMGLNPQTGVAGTGLVVNIEGQEPGSDLRILRADLDALPIEEQNQTAYKSTVPGVMHACGHDVHTTCLLGAASILQATRSEWKGTVRLLFQPGEEMLPGGASLMIKEGVLSGKPRAVLGQHVFPELPAGTVGFRPGQYMASTDELHVTVKGVGGHAAMPHKLVDAVLMASQLVVSMQQVASRLAPAAIPCVVSFGRVEALGATNVIPELVKLQGTFRTVDEGWRERAHAHMQRIAAGVAETFGGSIDFEIRKGYPSLFNDPALTLFAQEKAREYLGADKVVDLEMRMTAEDFAYYTHQAPGCFYRLGTAGSDGTCAFPVHHPNFDIDHAALETGVGLLAYLATH